MKQSRSRINGAGLILLLAVASSAAAAGHPGATPQEPTPTPPDTTALPNPFAGFETHRLSNGVKVWFKRLPGDPNVSVSAGIAVGSQADPPGKEQLAHFTEHMLFSNHNGRTEQEIKEALEGIGGRRNGYTYADHTWYYATVGREHGLFAIEWLGGILSPHAMEPEVVERGRQPVQNEIRAQPRELFDHLGALLNPAWLAPPDFWEREFGIKRERDPNPYVWRSLQGITPEDLRGFYDRYYAPAGLTVTIVGDLFRDEALAVAERTFGTFPEREVNRWEVELEDPGRGRSSYNWGFQATIRYLSQHKLFRPTADDLLTALFVRDLLNRRLGQRLRYGERKAVYGASYDLVQRGPAAYLALSTQIDQEDYSFAKEIIDEEIESLRTGSLDPAEFEVDREAVVERLRASNQAAESLNAWTRIYFYDPATFADFPDVVSFYQNVTQDQVASFVQAGLRPHAAGAACDATAARRPGDGGGRGGGAGVAHPDDGRAASDQARADEGDPVHRAVPPAGRSARGVCHRPRGGPGCGDPRVGGGLQAGGPLDRVHRHLHRADRRDRCHGDPGPHGVLPDLRRGPAQAASIQRPHPHQVARLALPGLASRGHRRDFDPALPRCLAESATLAGPAARLRPPGLGDLPASPEGQSLLLPRQGHGGARRGAGGVVGESGGVARAVPAAGAGRLLSRMREHYIRFLRIKRLPVPEPEPDTVKWTTRGIIAGRDRGVLGCSRRLSGIAACGGTPRRTESGEAPG